MRIIEGLRETMSATLPYFDLPPEDLTRTYGSGKWSIQEILHHLADAETVLYERIRRSIANPNQVVWGFDQDAWARELKYHEVPLSMNRAIFESVRRGIIYYAEHYYQLAGHHQMVHSKTGIKTLRDLFDKVVWHNRAHILQIQKALS